MDLAIASLAVLLEMDGKKCAKARLAAGSVAPIPLRLKKVEELLEGSIISEELVAKTQQVATESIFPISDIRASKEYRQQIVSVYLKRAVENLME